MQKRTMTAKISSDSESLGFQVVLFALSAFTVLGRAGSEEEEFSLIAGRVGKRLAWNLKYMTAF